MMWNQGEYNPIHPEKVIGIQYKNPFYRSGWERSVMLSFDQNPRVVRWGSEIYKIPYFFSISESKRNYYIDFYVEMLDSFDNVLRKFLVEVKPKEQVFQPSPPKKKTYKAMKNYNYRIIEFKKNRDKWNFANAFAISNGMQFIILTEGGVFIVQDNNIKQISDKKYFGSK